MFRQASPWHGAPPLTKFLRGSRPQQPRLWICLWFAASTLHSISWNDKYSLSRDFEWHAGRSIFGAITLPLCGVASQTDSGVRPFTAGGFISCNVVLDRDQYVRLFFKWGVFSARSQYRSLDPDALQTVKVFASPYLFSAFANGRHWFLTTSTYAMCCRRRKRKKSELQKKLRRDVYRDTNIC